MSAYMVKSDLLVYFFATTKFKHAALNSTVSKSNLLIKSVVGCQAKSTIEANSTQLQ